MRFDPCEMVLTDLSHRQLWQCDSFAIDSERSEVFAKLSVGFLERYLADLSEVDARLIAGFGTPIAVDLAELGSSWHG